MSVTRSGILLGAVLAGGESRRFGSAKALAPFQGEPLALRAARTLEEVCTGVVVVGRVDGLEPGDFFDLVPDKLPGMGPLGGLHAALVVLLERVGEDAEGAGVLLLGCDMPLVEPALARAVGWVGATCGRPAAAPMRQDEGRGDRLEPLCAWYGLGCLPVVEERLQGPDRSLHGLLEAVEAYPIPPARLGPTLNPGWALRSANTPEALEVLEEEARQRGEDRRGGRPEGPVPPVGAVRRPQDAVGGRRGPGEQPDAGVLPPAICVVGYKDSGKTGVSVALVAELRRRGHRVAAMKHGHGFRLDTPGSDSWRLRHEGGADPVLLTGPEGFAFMGSWEGTQEPEVEALLQGYLPWAELVVVEGFKGSPLPKVEVFRSARHPEPFFRSGAPGAEAVIAVVTDDEDLEAPVPVFDLDDDGLAARLADLMEERVLP